MTMFARKPSQLQAEEEERLRRALRELPHLKAPWYFESELQQRLQEGRSPRGFAARPVLATALTVLVLALVGSVGYYAYFSPFSSQTETVPDAVKPAAESPTQQVQTTQAPEPERQPVLVPAEGGSMNSGPSEPVNGAARRSQSAPVQTEQSPRELPAVVPGIDTDSEAQHEVTPLRTLPPVLQNAAVRTTDTLRAHSDTASKRRDSLHTSTPDTLRRIR